MNNSMTFSDTVEEFMEQNKVVDTEQIYSNGMEFVPIFRMRQWFEHMQFAEKTGKWLGGELGECSVCGHTGCASDIWDRCKEHFCPNCGAKMEGKP